MMNKYYILNFEIFDDSYFAENGSISSEKVIENYKEGISFKDEDLNIKFHKNKGSLLEVIDNLHGIPVVSEKILEVLKEVAENEFEYYPVKLGKQSASKYYYINILNNVDAIDYEKSEYTELIEGLKVLKSLEKLVLIDSQIENRNIFRLHGFKIRIVISEKMKNALEKLNLPELKIISLENYGWKLGKPDSF